jgi:predicted RNA binding protein YcfA (HicA-like mRNA interferase family)
MPLSGEQMLRRFLVHGWTVLRRRGSHVILGRGTFRETIPMHDELHRGLERRLLKRLASDEGADR